jgi:hypothetical protein
MNVEYANMARREAVTVAKGMVYYTSNVLDYFGSGRSRQPLLLHPAIGTYPVQYVARRDLRLVPAKMHDRFRATVPNLDTDRCTFRRIAEAVAAKVVQKLQDSELENDVETNAVDLKLEDWCFRSLLLGGPESVALTCQFDHYLFGRGMDRLDGVIFDNGFVLVFYASDVMERTQLEPRNGSTVGMDYATEAIDYAEAYKQSISRAISNGEDFATLAVEATGCVMSRLQRPEGYVHVDFPVMSLLLEMYVTVQSKLKAADEARKAARQHAGANALGVDRDSLTNVMAALKSRKAAIETKFANKSILNRAEEMLRILKLYRE